jgi:hypothetical protein
MQWDIIAYGSIDLLSDEGLPTVAKAFVATEINTADMGQVGNRDVFGNSSGHQLLEEKAKQTCKCHAQHEVKILTEVA